MRVRALIGVCSAVFGLSLALTASAGAVRPPNPVTTTISVGGVNSLPSCPTNLDQPPHWTEPNGIGSGNYILGPAQAAAAAPGSGFATVPTQTLQIVDTSFPFAITTAGCWQFFGDPQPNGNSPFLLLHWSTSQAVQINGVYLVPVNLGSPPTLVVGTDGTLTATGADTRYDIEAPPNNQPNGPLSIVGRVDLGATPYVWDPASGHLGSFGPSPQGPTFAGQPITGGDLSIKNVNDGTCLNQSAHAAASLPLPAKVFSTGPDSGPPPTGEADYNTSLPPQCNINQGGGGGGSFYVPPSCVVPTSCHHPIALQTPDLASPNGQPIHLTVPDLYVGGLEIHNAFLNYDPAQDLWSGGGDLQLGAAAVHAAPPPPNSGFGIHGDGSFAYGGAQFFPPPPGPPLFTGVNLTELGVTFALHPTTFSGDARINAAGGEVTIHGGVLVVNADSNEPYSYQAGALPGVNSLQTNTASNPITSFAAGVSGTVDLNEPGLGKVPLANGYVFYISPSYFEFAGNIQLSLATDAVTLNGNVSGALDTGSGAYNIAGSLNLCGNFPSPVNSLCVGASAIVSSAGIGACGNVNILGVEWHPGFRYDSGGLTLFLAGCDLAPITVVVRPARDARAARSARAAGLPGFYLPGGVPSTSVTVTGSGGAPRVLITGPHGERLSNPTPGRGAASSQFLILPMAKLGETLIGIKHPSGGRWTVTPLPGSPSITGLSYANGLPPARIRASVRGRGRALTLRYNVAPRAGQTVMFAERTRGVFHVLGRATANHGLVRFSPAYGRRGKRQIVALISLAGVPRQTLVVGHHTAPATPAPIIAENVRVARARRGLIVSWAPNMRWGCLVVATLSNGHRLLYSMSARQHSVKIPRLEPGVGARIAVSGLGPTGNASRATTATLPPARPAPVTGVVVNRAGRRLTIRWHRAAGAARYLVTITVRGKTRVTLFGITFEPKVTLNQDAPLLLSTSAVSRITVRAVNLAGQQGSAGTARYTPSRSSTPQPPPNRPLRAVAAIE